MKDKEYQDQERRALCEMADTCFRDCERCRHPASFRERWEDVDDEICPECGGHLVAGDAVCGDCGRISDAETELWQPTWQLMYEDSFQCVMCHRFYEDDGSEELKGPELYMCPECRLNLAVAKALAWLDDQS